MNIRKLIEEIVQMNEELNQAIKADPMSFLGRRPINLDKTIREHALSHLIGRDVRIKKDA